MCRIKSSCCIHAVTLVFVWFVHIAIYIGNGQVIDAKGNKEWVVKEDFNLSWTHFGIPFGLY